MWSLGSLHLYITKRSDGSAETRHSADLLVLTGLHAEKRSQTEKLDGTMVCAKTQYYFLLCK